MCIAGDVYYTLLGEMKAEYQIPDVENAFFPGRICAENYSAMLAAYERLCARLGGGEEDGDVEIIINAILDNQREIGLKMFDYGVRYGQNKPHP